MSCYLAAFQYSMNKDSSSYNNRNPFDLRDIKLKLDEFPLKNDLLSHRTQNRAVSGQS
jgi:hypothetical protein